MRKRRIKSGLETRRRQRLQTREARGREEGCGGRRRRISGSRFSSSSGGAADDDERWRLISSYSLTLLGFFLEEPHGISFLPTSEGPNRVPPGRFSLQFKPGNRFTLLDSRHGLVLISDQMRHQFVVWDPFTGDQHRLSLPPGFDPRTTLLNGAVLRAAGDVQRFRVVFVAAYNYHHNHGQAAAVVCVYSSETGEWGNAISTPIPPPKVHSGSLFRRKLCVTTVSTEAAVLVGDSIYWIINRGYYCSSDILEFNFEMQSLDVIRVPHVYIDHLMVIRADSGGLGLLQIPNFTMQLWKRETNCNGVALWRLGRTIELDKLLPLNPKKDNIMIMGFVEENNMVFLWALNDLYAVHLQSLEFKKLPEANIRAQPIHYPAFESVYAADVGEEHARAELFAQSIR